MVQNRIVPNRISHAQQSVRRRGVAMLLVIISVATATILATAYLASRDNSAAIGENASNAIAARWASESALETGLTILQTRRDWRTAHTGGMLFEDANFTGVLVTLQVTDRETGAPPTSDTEHVLLTTIARLGGLRQVTTATAFVPIKGDRTIDVTLNEFAAFTRGQMSFQDQSGISPWSSSPLSHIQLRQKIGTNARSAGLVEFGGSTFPADVTLFADKSASSNVQINNSPIPSHQVILEDPIPVYDPPKPPSGLLDGLLNLLFPPSDLTVESSRTISSDQIYRNLMIRNNNTVVQLNGNTGIATERDLTMEPGTTIRVSGQGTLLVMRDLNLSNAQILLAPNARLTIFAGGNVDLDGAYIGDEGDLQYNSHGSAGYIDPRRVEIYGVKPGSGSTRYAWTIDDTVIKGIVHAPWSNVAMSGTSALYGRIASDTITATGHSSIFYDHKLDRGVGFTNPHSRIYNSTGNIISTIVGAVITLDVVDLQALALLLDYHVYTTIGGVVSGLTADSEPLIGGTQPTPRPIVIIDAFESSGTSIERWETR